LALEASAEKLENGDPEADNGLIELKVVNIEELRDESTSCEGKETYRPKDSSIIKDACVTLLRFLKGVDVKKIATVNVNFDDRKQDEYYLVVFG
jgi:hypothetical protein